MIHTLSHRIVTGSIGCVLLLWLPGAFANHWMDVSEIAQATLEGDVARVVRLLREDPSRLNDESLAGRSLLIVAASRSNADMVWLYLALGIDPDKKDLGGTSALAAAAMRNDPQIVRMLLKGGAAAQSVNEGGETVLHYAVTGGNVTTIRLLVEAGADPHAKNEAGESAIDQARKIEEQGRRSEILRALGQAD